MNRFNLSASFVFLSFAIAGLLVAMGCNKNDGSTGNQVPNTAAMVPGAVQQDITDKLPGDAKFAEGKKVYSINNCARCHKLGETGNPRGRGPDLTKVGGRPDHTKDWLAAHIRNAKSQNPRSNMPPFPTEKINDDELNSLTDYLTSLK